MMFYERFGQEKQCNKVGQFQLSRANSSLPKANKIWSPPNFESQIQCSHLPLIISIMLFSVIVPLYNKADYIVATINSILHQTHQDFEVLVVDDGSTDGGGTLASLIPDARITVLRKPNGGVSSARNYGMQLAKGDFFAFLDADDIWLNNHLETIFGLIDEFNPTAKIFATSIKKS